MDIIEYRDYCLSLPLTEETTPFDEDTLVYKIAGKMYTYASIGQFTWIGLKCDPDEAAEWRERYAEIGYAPHMNKTHWIGVNMCGDLPEAFVKELISNSYKLVIDSLPKMRKNEIIDTIDSLAGVVDE